MSGGGFKSSVRLRWAAVVALALFVTVINAFKPIHIDDAFYYTRAAYLVDHPFDFIGGQVFAFQWPTDGRESAVPPVLLYWLMPAVKLFGDQPVLLKLWLFPFSVIFVAAVAALMRRFARRWTAPLTCMMVLSPAMLPSWNLMLDLPTLSLSLASLVIFMRSCPRRSWALAVAAGVMAALAMQTKYTGLAAPAAIGAYALVFRRWRLGIIATAVAAAGFWAWEAAQWLQYGQSQFVWTVLYSFPNRMDKLDLAGSLLTVLGPLHVGVVILALAAAGKRVACSPSATVVIVGG